MRINVISATICYFLSVFSHAYLLNNITHHLKLPRPFIIIVKYSCISASQGARTLQLGIHIQKGNANTVHGSSQCESSRIVSCILCPQIMWLLSLSREPTGTQPYHFLYSHTDKGTNIQLNKTVATSFSLYDLSTHQITSFSCLVMGKQACNYCNLVDS